MVAKSKKVLFEGVELLIEVNDSGEKTVSVIGDKVNLNFNDKRLVTIEEKIDLGKIYAFVEEHKYKGDTVATDSKNKNEKNITLCLKGYEFCSHWIEEGNKDTNTFSMNDFIPNHKSIIEGLSDLGEEVTKKYMSPTYHEEPYNEFTKNLNHLGVKMIEHSNDEYDVLTEFVLPSNKLDDADFITQFMNEFTKYRNAYNEELDTLYCPKF